MSGAWRDTVFLLGGTIEVGDDCSSLSWAGGRLKCIKSPDARCVPMPTHEGLRESNSKFTLQGHFEKETDRRDEKVTISLTGKWGHNDEGDDKPAAAKCLDAIHQISFQPFALQSLVVGSGHNEFGHFVEVGITAKYGSNPASNKYMILARRYLQDGDERASWSLDRLESEVIFGLPPLLGQQDWWSNVVDFVGYDVDDDAPPWQQSLVLHSAIWDRLVLRNNQGRLLKTYRVDSPPPLLSMPTQDGKPFELQVAWTEDIPEGFSSNIIWKRQCWGCGGPRVRDELQFYCTLNQRLGYNEDGDYDCDKGNVKRHPGYMKAEFCSGACVVKAALQLAEASLEFREDSSHIIPGELENYLTTSHSLPFWKCLRESDRGLLLMTSAGWKMQSGGEFGLWVAF